MSKYQFAALLIAIVLTQSVGVWYLDRPGTRPDTLSQEQFIQVLRQDIAELKHLQLQNAADTNLDRYDRMPEPELLRQTIDQALQESLAEILQPSESERLETTDDALLPPSEQQMIAYEQALLTLETAVSSGIWTDENNRTLLPYASQLSPQQHADFNRRFTRAVQNGEIELQGAPPLF